MADRIVQGINPVIPSNYRRVPHVISSSTGGGTIQFQGGMTVVIALKNINILGTTMFVTPDNRITPFANRGESIILPQHTALFFWSRFGGEPMSWSFELSTVSDACVIDVKAFSTWIQGMPPNR